VRHEDESSVVEGGAKGTGWVSQQMKKGDIQVNLIIIEKRAYPSRIKTPDSGEGEKG